jgi:hypothetical protein
MSLFSNFENEALFRSDFVRPLLNKLGFFLVTDYHGRREFGKDFVFSELHRFGGVRNYAAQIKHEKKINLGKMIDDLLTDVHQAFSNPFTLPDSKNEVYISALYIFNSGGITVEAKDDLINRLRKAQFGENVYLLNGERLDSLNRWATFQNDQNVRQRLSGLRNQLYINIKIWTSIKENVKNKRVSEARGSFLSGSEAFLSSPLFPETISENDIMQLWQIGRIIDSICKRYILGVRVSEEIRNNDFIRLNECLDKAMLYASQIIQSIDKVLTDLKPL